MDYVEEFDKLKTKVLKYILFKKRTEQEVRQKFREDSGEMLDDVIEELKEYEIQSAKNIAIKKQNSLEKEDIIAYLAKKGYLSETIKIALEE